MVDTSLNRLFVSNEEAQLVLPDGTTYTGDNVDFVVAGPRATWIGDMEGSGGEEPAKITIAC